MFANDSSKRSQQANVTYRVNNTARKYENFTLIDCEYNGSLDGDDILPLAVSDYQKVDVNGIQNNKFTDLPVETGAGKIMTTDEPVIGIFHQYA